MLHMICTFKGYIGIDVLVGKINEKIFRNSFRVILSKIFFSILKIQFSRAGWTKIVGDAIFPGKPDFLSLHHTSDI